jgi:hypothetical protein
MQYYWSENSSGVQLFSTEAQPGWRAFTANNDEHDVLVTLMAGSTEAEVDLATDSDVVYVAELLDIKLADYVTEFDWQGNADDWDEDTYERWETTREEHDDNWQQLKTGIVERCGHFKLCAFSDCE